MKFWGAMFAVATVSALAPVGATAQQLPYKAVHDPQFISARAATFLHDGDRVIGVVEGKTAKSYPAAILARHGLVEDRSPEGPIAITW